MRKHLSLLNGVLVGILIIVLLVTIIYYNYPDGSETDGPQKPVEVALSPTVDEPDPKPILIPLPTKRPEPPNGSGTVSGTVRFAETDAPATGTLVQVRDKSYKHLSVYTDEVGSFTLRGVPAEYAVTFTAENEDAGFYMLHYPKAFVKPGEIKTGVNLKVYHKHDQSISGRVFGGIPVFDPEEKSGTRMDKAPLPNAEVKLKCGLRRIEKITYSDEEGKYLFENLPAGHYGVTVTLIEGTAMRNKNARSVDIDQDSLADVDFIFNMGGVSISGRVLDSEGAPMEGISVSGSLCVVPEGRSFSEIKKTGPTVHAKTDEEGRYKLINMPPVSFLTASNYIQNGKLRMFYKVQTSIEEIYIPSITEKTLAEGFQALEHLIEAGKANFRIQESISTSEYPLPKSKGNDILGIDFVLEKRTSVSGFIVDTKGRIVPKGGSVKKILLASEETPPLRPMMMTQLTRRSISASAGVDKAGRFTFKGVPKGKYYFKVRLATDPGGAKARRTNNEAFTVNAGEKIENMRVVILAPEDLGKIKASVLDAITKEPLEKVKAYLKRDGSPRHIQIEGSPPLPKPNPSNGVFSLDQENVGDFRIEKIDPGPAVLYVGVSEYSEYGMLSKYVWKKMDIDVIEGENLLDPILLDPKGRVSGHVRDSDSGNPISQFWADYTPGSYSSRLVKEDQTTPGDFRIHNCPPGKVNIHIGAKGYARKDFVLGVKSGEVTDHVFEMEPESSLEGFVTINGEPATKYKYEITAFPAIKELTSPFHARKKDGGFYSCMGMHEDEYSIDVKINYSDVDKNKYEVHYFDIVKTISGESIQRNYPFVENAAIMGSFENEMGNPLLEIDVYDAENPERLHASVEISPRAFSYGIKYLSPGSYIVVARYRDYSKEGAFKEISKLIALQTAQVVRLDFGSQ